MRDDSKYNFIQTSTLQGAGGQKKEDVMKRFQVLTFVCFFVALCLLVTSFPANAQEKVIRLKYANFFPPVHKQSVLAEQWCKELEKRTNGRVKITYLPGGTLVPAPQSYEAVVGGIADISQSSPQWMAGRFPLTEALYLPLGLTDGIRATNLTNEWFAKFKPKEYDDTKVLYFHTPAPGCIMTLKPVATIDGVKGLKIRAAGDTAKIVAALGAIPVSVPLGDIYEGLQRGVMDGIIFPPEALKGFRFGDMIRSMQENPAIAYASPCIVVMNKTKWNSLPADIQTIITKLNEEWIDRSGKIWVEVDKEGIEYGISKGMKIVKLSKDDIAKTEAMVKPLLETYVKNMTQKGLPGAETLKYLQDWITAHP
jgi:TRAP-type C4-dicarboxylate transport system substrate-binding protein